MEVGVYNDLNQIGSDDWLDINEYVFLYVRTGIYWLLWGSELIVSLSGLFYSCQHVITHPEYHDLPVKLDW